MLYFICLFSSFSFLIRRFVKVRHKLLVVINEKLEYKQNYI